MHFGNNFLTKKVFLRLFFEVPPIEAGAVRVFARNLIRCFQAPENFRVLRMVEGGLSVGNPDFALRVWGAQIFKSRNFLC